MGKVTESTGGWCWVGQIQVGDVGQNSVDFDKIVGYSGRAVNSMTLRPNQSGILEACKDCPEIYSDGKRVYREEEAPLDAARQHLYEVIRRATASLFQSGQDLIQKLHERVPEDQPVEHWETLRGTFQNTATLPAEEILQRYGLQAADLRPWKPGAPLSTRDAHATLIGSALKSRRRYLFLTGNPGIGKTTSIANYLKECCHGEGYLLFYASPRKAVNRDIFSKFQEGEQPSNGAPMPFYTGRFLGLSTNATLIRNAGGGAAVEYVGTAIPPPQSRRGVRFLTHEEVEQQRLDHGPISTHRRVTQVTEDVLHDRGKQGAGVLQTICTAIGASLDRTRPNSIVASIAIQSLKRSEQGKDTLDHLYEIFASAYNHREGAFLDAQMRALANTTKHIIIMIDEITGDEAGYEFFRRVSEWLDDVHLEQYGFQPTIIVSDASITGVEVVRAHFRLNQHEPDARKIYLMLAPPQHQMATTDPISLVPFSFDQQDDAYLVNSNSYPANALHLRYKIRTPLLELSEQMSKHDQKVLLSDWIMEQGVDQEIIRDVCALLEDPTREGQTIVYIQDKRRLQRIIQAIEKRRKQMGKEFLSGEHYVQIHADSSESEREHIEDPAKRDRFLVIFMTSSASRGLTFSKARHLLVDVARFTIETNLMEIIQVLYRGRGGEYDLGEKYVTFYLSDRIIAHVGRRDAGIREGLISLMTMLSLLKMCLMTRISGAASLRDRPVGLIPIGGKSVSGSGRAYHHDLANFARALRQQLRGPQSNDPILTAVHKAVTNLMDHVQILPPYVQGSYLSLYENNSPERLDKWLRSDEQIEDAYVLGNLLLVPMAVDTETIHHFGLSSEIATAVQKETFSALRAIRNDPRKYPPTIHDGAKDFQQLLYELQDAERSQRLEQRGGLQQGYYVVPLTIFVAKGPISAYCRELREQVQSDESTRLRNALYRYVRDSYPVDTLLPIASWYHDFPFLVITSQDLKALRAKTFQTGHTLMSREMNLLTLLLSDE